MYPRKRDKLNLARMVVTDDEGRATFCRQPKEQVYATVSVAGQFAGVVAKSDSRFAEIRLQKPKEIQLTVAGEAGHPVINATLFSPYLRWPVGKTDAEGRLNFPKPQAPLFHRFWVLGADKIRGMRLGKESDFRVTTKLEVTPGMERQVRIARPFVWDGIVLDSITGQPVQGAQVSELNTADTIATTSDNGRFRLEGAPSASEYRWLVVSSEYSLPQLFRVSVDDSKLTLAVKPPLRLKGTVTDSQGNGIHNATIRIEPIGVVNSTGASFDQGNAHAVANSTVAGDYKLNVSTPGRYRITASGEGFTPGPAREVIVPATAGHVPVELGATILTAGLDLLIQTVDTLGNPVDSAKVNLSPESACRFDAGSGELLSDSSGFLQLEDCEVDVTVAIRAHKPGSFSYATRTIKLPSFDPVILSLPASVAISGRVVDLSRSPIPTATRVLDAEGVAIPQAFVELRPTSRRLRSMGQKLFAHTTSDGRFELSPRESGPQELSIRKEGFLRLAEELVFAPGLHQTDFVLRKAAFVSGMVKDLAGRAVRRAVVRLETADFRSFRATTTGADGTFRVAFPSDGPHVLTARKDGFARSAYPEVISASDSDHLLGVTLTLTPGTLIRGMLSGIEPQKIDGYSILIKETPELVVKPDSTGLFEIPNVASGLWTMIVRSSLGEKVHQVRLEIPKGEEEAYVEIVVSP